MIPRDFLILPEPIRFTSYDCPDCGRFLRDGDRSIRWVTSDDSPRCPCGGKLKPSPFATPIITRREVW